jgi:NAD(P)-dependent dehydrogenase (short-subunit alcohol dehydrogenase family)
MTPDGFETVWAAHHLGPVLLVDRLMGLLTASPQGRIINISSKGLLLRPFLTVNLKDCMFAHRPYSAVKAFYQSKMAQLMYTLWLAGRLPGTMVTANCIRGTGADPSHRHDLPLWTRRILALESLWSSTHEQVAETCVRAALDKKLSHVTGRLFDYPLKEVALPAYARDPYCIEQVMELSYRQLGLRPAMSFEAAPVD